MSTEPLSDTFGYGLLSARPTAGIAGRVYYATDGPALYRDNGTTWNTLSIGGGLTVEEADGSPTDSAVTKLVFPAGSLAIASHIATIADDPVRAMFGAPDTAYEFDSSSLSGLTAWGTPTAEDANTTVPGHYYVKAATNASPHYRGRGVAVSTPFSAICKVSCNPDANFEQAGLLIATSGYSASGAMEVLGVGWGSGTAQVNVEAWSAPGTYSSTPVVSFQSHMIGQPLYFGIAATSSTSIAWYYSFDGRIWRTLTTGRNPGFTIAQVGLVASAQNTTGFVAAFDFLRVWNSVKTFVA